MTGWRVALGLGLTAAAIHASTASAQSKGGAQRPLVLTVAGITVGLKTTDPQVVRMFGLGCFVQEEGHGGARYFLNSERSVTLHTVIGVDRATEMVELSAFIDLPRPCAKAAAVTSVHLGTLPEVDHGIRLGMTPERVIELLGRPDADELKGSARTLVYRTSIAKDPRVTLDYQARYRFVGDRLTRISIYDGE